MDINCDLGEGIGNDAQIIPYISSCSIACGGHAGDKNTMLKTIRLAKRYGVKVGAHPSFPDRKNFGRVNMSLSNDVLKESLIEQIASLKEIAEKENVRLHHVKPHGALYTMAAENEDLAEVIIEVMRFFDGEWKLYVPYHSVIAKKAKENGISYYYEAFADRNYNDDLTLVSRSESHAVIEDIGIIYKRVERIFKEQSVLSINNKQMKIKVDTVCVHGDNANAIPIVQTLHNLIK
jgi:UPF0271 protein